MEKPKKISLKVQALSRVEGEGALDIRIKDGRVTRVHLRIYEPPRFFEALLRGRPYADAPDITARICGICPVAYQMSAVTALESIPGFQPGDAIQNLRRLLYFGEWIESHTLHILMLHAPDFFGVDSVFDLARSFPEHIRDGLTLKKIGNALVSTLGGREIHPVNVRVGGFYKIPPKQTLTRHLDALQHGLEIAVRLFRWVTTFPFPDFERTYVFVSMDEGDVYPVFGTHLNLNNERKIPVQQFEEVFEEVQVRHSHALHSRLKDGRTYLLGPLARINLNHTRLSPTAQALIQEAGLTFPIRNPFQSVIARALEVVHALESSIEILENGDLEPDRPYEDLGEIAGTGMGCTEAPRGILYHRYRVAPNGEILEAKIVPPTAQNQACIEEDLYHLASQRVHLPVEQWARECEHAIRNYDPCISCATHFLKIRIIEEP